MRKPSTKTEKFAGRRPLSHPMDAQGLSLQLRKSWFVNSRRVKLNSIVYGGLGSCCSMFTSNRRITSIQSITGDGLGCTYSFLIEYMLRLSRVRSDVIWLPFGPLSGVGLTVYVDHLLTNSSEEIRKLPGYVYAYKAI